MDMTKVLQETPNYVGNILVHQGLTPARKSDVKWRRQEISSLLHGNKLVFEDGKEVFTLDNTLTASIFANKELRHMMDRSGDGIGLLIQ
jgi:hypothetical protein